MKVLKSLKAEKSNRIKLLRTEMGFYLKHLQPGLRFRFGRSQGAESPAQLRASPETRFLRDRAQPRRAGPSRAEPNRRSFH